MDVVLVSPGKPTPFPNLTHRPDMREGVSFNLANNIWGTNYIMWQPYDGELSRYHIDDISFRFVLQVNKAPGKTGSLRSSSEA